MKCEPRGLAAWTIAENQILPAPILNSDPKFAIIPRDCSSPATSVAEENNSYENNFEVYPVPSLGKISVLLKEQADVLQVTDVTGRILISKEKIQQGNTNLD